MDKSSLLVKVDMIKAERCPLSRAAGEEGPGVERSEGPSHLEIQRLVFKGPDARRPHAPLPCSLEAKGGPSRGPTVLTQKARVPAGGISAEG